LGCDARLEIEKAVERLRSNPRFVREYCGVPVNRVDSSDDGVGVKVVSTGRRMPTVEQVERFRKSFRLSRLYGVIDVGVGTDDCRHSTPPRHGVFSITLLPCSSALDSVAEAVIAAAQRELPSLAVALWIGVPIPKARCNEDDANCRAIPYRRTARALSADETRRKVVMLDPVDETNGRAPGWACVHDGDCVVAGCGNECVSWPFGWFDGTCPSYGALKRAYCGCVDGLCNWFTEAPLAPR
jgi:hypothetical protein